VFNAVTGDLLHTISMKLGDIDSIRFLDPGKIMCLTNFPSRVVGMFGIWDLTKSADVLTFKCEEGGYAMSSDGTRVVSSQDNIVKIWQTDTTFQNQDTPQDTSIQNKHHRVKPVKKILKMMKSAFISPHRKNHAKTPRSESEAASRHTDAVKCVSFSKDEQLAASGSNDTTVKIWDTSTGQCLNTLRNHHSFVREVIFSPDSRLCASWGWDFVI
jgi:WD40 repeat protein